MACKRSAVRSRLAPPAFARFASFGWASHNVAYRGEASEGCLAVARRAKAGWLASRASAGQATMWPIVAKRARQTRSQRRRPSASLRCSLLGKLGGRAMKYVYILESLDSQHFYVGITDDLRARLAKHNAGAVPHTSKYRPWRIRTYVAFSDEHLAIAFEKYRKSGSGRAFTKKRL
jgi:putative endonuclease